jgi:hypothetical protein
MFRPLVSAGRDGRDGWPFWITEILGRAAIGVHASDHGELRGLAPVINKHLKEPVWPLRNTRSHLARLRDRGYCSGPTPRSNPKGTGEVRAALPSARRDHDVRVAPSGPVFKVSRQCPHSISIRFTPVSPIAWIPSWPGAAACAYCRADDQFEFEFALDLLLDSLDRLR